MSENEMKASDHMEGAYCGGGWRHRRAFHDVGGWHGRSGWGGGRSRRLMARMAWRMFAGRRRAWMARQWPSEGDVPTGSGHDPRTVTWV
jgi:hypothetical protein